MVSSLAYDRGGVAPPNLEGPFSVSDANHQELRAPIDRGLQRVVDAHESGELGFLDLADADVAGIEEWASRKREGRWTDAVVVGIGGSSLGTRAIHDAAPATDLGGLRLHVTENVDPESFARLLDEVRLDTTLFVVVTKSGTTIETMGKFAVVHDLLTDELGPGRAASQIVAVTSPDSGALRDLARSEGFESFSIPPNVGGRFSVLSPVGLVPLALAGYPIDELLAGARAARDRALSADFEENAIRKACADIFTLQSRGVGDLVMMAYADRLEGLVDWFRQLWAESLGKARNRSGEEVHTGMTPIKAVGTIDQHSQVQLYMEGPPRRLVTFLALEQFEREVTIPEEGLLPERLAHLGGRPLSEVMAAELEGTQEALARRNRPTTRWTFDAVTPRAVGGFVMAWEIMTAVMGELLDIDAYDQPGVELGKRLAHGRLGDPNQSEHRNPEFRSRVDVVVPH